MKLNDKNILLISPEPWSHLKVSKHHYAIYLADRNNRVYFLNPPTSGRIRYDNTEYSNVYSVHYDGFYAGMRFYPKFLRQYLMRQKLQDIQSTCHVDFDIIWSFDNSVFFDFEALSKRAFYISHIVDLNQNFQLDQAAKTADICLANSRAILQKLKRVNKKSFFVNHGYNDLNNREGQIKLPGKNKIKVLYAGNLDIIYLDWASMDLISTNHQNVDFVFMGKCEKLSTIFKKENVHYIGIVPAEHLYSYYIKADILLLCYLADEYESQLSNPHKLMEYLGSGKLIVATKTLEFEHLKNSNLLLMSDKNLTFPKCFTKALDNIDSLNRIKYQKERRNIALNNTYARQIDKVEMIIEQNGK